jgi:predicted DNA-binding protein (MmcQ/YjbR family)
LRPAAFFCAVVPPWLELERDEPELELLPPRLDEPGEFAIRAARCFDMPFFFRPSYCFSFLTLARLPGIGDDPSSLIVVALAIPGRRVCKTIRELALSLPETYEDAPWGFPVFKVADNRMFAWLHESEPVELTVKLTADEREIAHLHPWVRTASHVGRYGWITATIEDGDALETALEWLRDSYYLKAPAALRDAAFAE